MSGLLGEPDAFFILEAKGFGLKYLSGGNITNDSLDDALVSAKTVDNDKILCYHYNRNQIIGLISGRREK